MNYLFKLAGIGAAFIASLWIAPIPTGHQIRPYQTPFTLDGSHTNYLVPPLAPTGTDRKSTRLNSSHVSESRMPSSA